MPSIDEVRDTLNAARAVVLTRLFSTTDAAEQARLEAARDAIDAEISSLNDAALIASARAISAASSALTAVLDSARTDPTVQFGSQLQQLLAALDAHHDDLHSEVKLDKAAADGAAAPPVVPPAAPPDSPGPSAPPSATPAAAPSPTGVSSSTNYPALQDEYAALFRSCVIDPSRQAVVAGQLAMLQKGQARYAALVAGMAIPWWVVAVLHGMEANFNFQRNLCNGDPLTARTVNVPSGRPPTGMPPFTWEAGARDALDFDHLSGEQDFSLPHTLFLFERYNGMGYRKRQIATPYLWSFSNHYLKGKFVADNVFDPNAVSKQVGAAVLMKALQATGVAIG